MLRDNFGVWTGKRRFAVKLKKKPGSTGELIHPPGSFSIGPDRGFLTYPGQPVYCRRCGGGGHDKATCPGNRCRFCGASGHNAADCPAPRSCSLCGSEEHLFRACPARQRTYAQAVRSEEEIPPPSDGVSTRSASAVEAPPEACTPGAGRPAEGDAADDPVDGASSAPAGVPPLLLPPDSNWADATEAAEVAEAAENAGDDQTVHALVAMRHAVDTLPSPVADVEMEAAKPAAQKRRAEASGDDPSSAAGGRKVIVRLDCPAPPGSATPDEPPPVPGLVTLTVPPLSPGPASLDGASSLAQPPKAGVPRGGAAVPGVSGVLAPDLSPPATIPETPTQEQGSTLIDLAVSAAPAAPLGQPGPAGAVAALGGSDGLLQSVLQPTRVPELPSAPPSGPKKLQKGRLDGSGGGGGGGGGGGRRGT